MPKRLSASSSSKIAFVVVMAKRPKEEEGCNGGAQVFQLIEDCDAYYCGLIRPIKTKTEEQMKEKVAKASIYSAPFFFHTILRMGFVDSSIWRV
ncbi:hypothetical protein H6P81_020086 [Aristolochia fimbriata]|uniref:Uncharacterized protein n=1 Tax=Aristolochia fimbriata TaxID=158543 RepID=A0AAV7DWG9_ARIFI|nr:hypothetical protein H6P81_020086 [Aristolochia fimbriata]